MSKFIILFSVLTDHESPTNRDYSDDLVKTESFKADQMASTGGTTAISERSPHDENTAGHGTYTMQRYNTASNILQPSSSAIQPGASPNDYGSSSSSAAAAAAASSSLLPVGSGGVTNPGYGQTGVTSGSSSSHYGQHPGYYGGGAHAAAAVATGNSSGMYLNPLQASFFYPHLYSSAAGINASGIHLHGNSGQHHSLNPVAGEHHSPLDEFGVPTSVQDGSISRGMEDTGYSHLDPGDESQTGPIRGAYGSGRSEHGVWRPY